MSDKTLFNALLILHLLTGIALALLIYVPPAHDSNTYTMVVRILIFPVLVLSGGAMYVYPWMKKASQNGASAQ